MFGFLSQALVGPRKSVIVKRYYNALVAAGVSATDAQKTAISNFVDTGYLQGWLPKIKRLCFLVWGNAAANAIDFTNSGKTMNWVGTVTHTGKSSQGDGATGYLNMNIVPSLELASNNCGVCYISLTNSIGNYVDIGARLVSGGPATDVSAYNYMGVESAYASTALVNGGSIASNGLFMMNATPGSTVRLTRNTGSGPVQIGTPVSVVSGALPTVPIDLMALNLNGVHSFFSPRSYTAGAVFKDLTHAQADAFSSALYTLITSLRS